jgi:hypothetical protein
VATDSSRCLQYSYIMAASLFVSAAKACNSTSRDDDFLGIARFSCLVLNEQESCIRSGTEQVASGHHNGFDSIPHQLYGLTSIVRSINRARLERSSSNFFSNSDCCTARASFVLL